MPGPIKGFIRRNGRVIPLRGALVTGAKAAAIGGSAYEVHKSVREKKTVLDRLKPKIKVNPNLDAAGLGISVASGAIGALTFGKSVKAFTAGMVASHALDAGGVAINLASVKGRGRKADRLKQAAKQEARNIIVGNAVYFGGIAASKAGRAAVKTGAKKVLGLARKVLRVV